MLLSQVVLEKSAIYNHCGARESCFLAQNKFFPYFFWFLNAMEHKKIPVDMGGGSKRKENSLL